MKDEFVYKGMQTTGSKKKYATIENQEKEFFVETTITTTVVHKVRANSFEQAKHFVEIGSVRSRDAVDSTAHREVNDVTEKYRSIFKDIE